MGIQKLFYYKYFSNMIQHLYPEEKYLWKFFDLYKFISFLKTKEIIFNRLDQFEDAMDGCSEEMAYSLSNDIRSSELNQPERNLEDYEKNRNEFILKLNTLKNSQKNIFASCFYAANEESIAMWKLYAGVQGVAIRFNSMELYKNLRKVHYQTIADNTDLGGNKMDYINLLNTSHYKGDEDIKKLNQCYSAYNKDISYKHENEYRFILINHSFNNADTAFKTLKIDLDEKYIDFIVSPDTENWKKELLNELINENGFKKTVKNSDIITKDLLIKYKLKFLDDILRNSGSPRRTITMFCSGK